MTEATSRRARMTAYPYKGETGVVDVNPFKPEHSIGCEYIFTFDNANRGWPQSEREPHPGRGGWYVNDGDFEYLDEPVAQPTIATALKLGPQDRTVLAHLLEGKPITPMKALVVYGIFRLAACIHRIRKAGYSVTTKTVQDEAGHKYAEYVLA